LEVGQVSYRAVEVDRIADVVCADMRAEERRRIRERLLKCFEDWTVYFWRPPMAQADPEVTNRLCVKI
jgi:hypothetical protein